MVTGMVDNRSGAAVASSGSPSVVNDRLFARIDGVMALTRSLAHVVFRRVSTPVMLCGGCMAASVGLFALSRASWLGATLAAAFAFALGMPILWPTMIGLVSERLPKTGALGLGLMAASGSDVAALLTTPPLGRGADGHLLDDVQKSQLDQITQAATVRVPTVSYDGVSLLRSAAARDHGRAAAGLARPVPLAANNRAGLLPFRELVRSV